MSTEFKRKVTLKSHAVKKKMPFYEVLLVYLISDKENESL